MLLRLFRYWSFISGFWSVSPPSVSRVKPKREYDHPRRLPRPPSIIYLSCALSSFAHASSPTPMVLLGKSGTSFVAVSNNLSYSCDPPALGIQAHAIFRGMVSSNRRNRDVSHLPASVILFVLAFAAPLHPSSRCPDYTSRCRTDPLLDVANDRHFLETVCRCRSRAGTRGGAVSHFPRPLVLTALAPP